MTKKDLRLEDPDAKYPAYIINRCMSGHLDTIMFVNEMNQYHFLSESSVFVHYKYCEEKEKILTNRKDKSEI